MTTKEIGEKIRMRRELRQMTQRDLAIATHVSESAIAMYEAGKRRPKPNVGEALADVFNVPLWSIYYNEDEVIPASEKYIMSSPKTPEARIVSGAMDKMPKEKRDQVLAVVRAMFQNNPDLFKD